MRTRGLSGRRIRAGIKPQGHVMACRMLWRDYPKLAEWRVDWDKDEQRGVKTYVWEVRCRCERLLPPIWEHVKTPEGEMKFGTDSSDEDTHSDPMYLINENSVGWNVPEPLEDIPDE